MKRCEHCDEGHITSTNTKARYCSTRCQQAAWEQRNREHVREDHRQRSRDRYQADPARAAAVRLDWYRAHPERQAQRHAALQEETREQATHHKEPWEEAELEVVTRDDLSIKETALMLGRTYGAVARQRSLMRRRAA
jgi:hypothetical protein